MKKPALLLLCLLSTVVAANAQYFLPALTDADIGRSKRVIVEPVNGEELSGKITYAMVVNGQLKSFGMKDEQGEKHKFKAADVQRLRVVPDDWANLNAASTNPSIKGLAHFDEVMDREFVYYEQALLPKKKDKYALMQLLNPGFDSKIKVYKDPNAKQTGLGVGGVKVTGGDDKSYLIVNAEGDKSFLFKKNKFKKEAMETVFNNCPVFADNYDPKKMKWANFAEYVFVFDQLCE